MKKAYYQMNEEISDGFFLHYCSYNNSFLVLNKEKHDIYENMPCEEIERKDSTLYDALVHGYFIIPDDYDECKETIAFRQRQRTDTNMYHIVVNTTLDCNLCCWYCYENRIPGSRLTPDVVEAIKKNICWEYEHEPYKALKVGFFGGEPFLDFENIQDILSYAKTFCEERNLVLIADFTTNATLITPEKIDFLKDFACQFQITLDGDREVHNTVKRDIQNPTDTYQKTIDVIRLIDSRIPDHWLAVRVNFDNRTLERIDEIIADISFLNRTQCFVILKKVWQVKPEKINTSLLHAAIEKFLDNKFLVDYYIMPKGGVCFATRKRETLFNYDGKVFKCTTISTFDDANSLGKLDKETGQVCWNADKMADWMSDKEYERCMKCKWFPVCLGVCNKQKNAHPDEEMCDFNIMGLTPKEYLMYSFKHHLLKKELRLL